MQLQPIVYVTNMASSTAWYTQLLARSPTLESEHWTTFTVDSATLALHATDQAQGTGDVGLSLVTQEPLEQAAARMGIDQIDDQPFGRSFTVTDPDGVKIQVNEHHD